MRRIHRRGFRAAGSSKEEHRRNIGFRPKRHTGGHRVRGTASAARIAATALAAALVVLAALTSWPATAPAAENGGPASASAEETGGAECASISARAIEKQMNLRASEILVKCGVMPAGSAAGS